MIKVLVVDDHDLVRAGITRMLADQDDIDVVGEAASGEDAITKTSELRPDVVLMDIQMPGIGGLQAISRIDALQCNAKVMAVTACTTDPVPNRVMQAGALAYLTKGADFTEMLKAVRMVARGGRYLSPEIAQQMALKQFTGEAEDTAFSKLSDREMQIAQMIVNCVKVQDISDQLCLSPKTVNTYRYRIFEKLDVQSDVELVLMAVRYGMLDADRVT